MLKGNTFDHLALGVRLRKTISLRLGVIVTSYSMVSILSEHNAKESIYFADPVGACIQRPCMRSFLLIIFLFY